MSLKYCPRILQYLSQKNVICPRKKIPENPRMAPEKYGMYARPKHYGIE